MSDPGFTSFEDQAEIASKIIEMADRVKVMHSVMPGAQATLVFELDDIAYRVVVSVNTTTKASGNGGGV